MNQKNNKTDNIKNAEETRTETTAENRRIRLRNGAAMQDWKNFMFFAPSKETTKNVTKLLKEREYLLSNSRPNEEKITEDARFFAASLVKRLSGNRRAQRYGLANIAEDIRKLASSLDMPPLYFYIANLYGMVFWDAPYNLQRLPAHPEALSMYLNVYINMFFESINSMKTEEPEPGEEKQYETD